MDPKKMKWFARITVFCSDLHHWADPVYERTSRELEAGQVECQEILEDGSRCSVAGTLSQLGVHMCYAHGKCNPVKALVLTNQRPGCYVKLASVGLHLP